MPVLNEAGIVDDTLATLQELRDKQHEVILVDGGSSDGTADIARPCVDHVLVCRKGRAQQMNAGAGRARGDVLLFLHADTLLPESADALIIDALQNPRYVWGRFDVRFPRASIALRTVALCMNLRSRLTGIATGDQAIFVTRAAFEPLRGFADIPLMEDVEFTRRLKQLSAPVCLRAKVTTSSRRWQNQGVFATVLKMWWLRWRYFLGASPHRLVKHYYP
ncbi:MAG: TIGR04283 family arsenosugar biosynthesis glycosyltransferase [Gammaproteobacteria bacterium]